jgi:hypothetical protein
MSYGLYFVGALLLAVLVAGACGGDNNGATAGRTELPPAEGTPARFEALRGALADRLEAIQVNIAAIPDDVQREIVDLCRELEAFIDEDRVDEICGALDEAIDRGDPGRIDRILAELAELED